MPLKRLSIAALTVVVLSFSALLAFGRQVPPRPSGLVADLSETLIREEIKSLEFKVADFNAKTATPIAILLIPTLAGDSLEDYSIRLAEKWKIGKDNGVLLLLVLEDRMVRIQVGSKLKGTLPDDRARAIISKEIAPRLRKDDFYGGIYQGLWAIGQATKGRDIGAFISGLVGLIFLLAFIVFPFVDMILRLTGVFKNGDWHKGYYDALDWGSQKGLGPFSKR